VSNKGVKERGGTVGKQVLKVKGTIVIRMKRGMQWTRLQIRVLMGPRHFFLTPAELYSSLNTSAMEKFPNSQ
jgi:hypothetical protein